MGRGRLVVALLIIVLPGIVLTPVWINGGLGAGEDDILYYYPMRSLLAWFNRTGEPPFLNPWTGCGRPYLADPQTAVFYPASWLFAIMPPEWAYPLSLWMHYSLALFGAYRLSRACGCTRPAATFAAIAFGLGGFLVSHRAHFSMQHAAAWTPVVLWRLQRFRHSHLRPDPSRYALAVLAIALQLFAGHVQVAALTALAAAILAVSEGGDVALVVRVRRVLSAWLLAGLIFAVQWAPTLVYTAACDRGQRTYWDFVENSFHPASSIAVLLPMLMGQRTPNIFAQAYWGPSHQVEQLAYIGIAPLVLAVLAVRTGGWHDRARRPWIVLGVVGGLLALGRYGPLCPILYWLPGASLLRCPARALLLVNLATTVLAGQMLRSLTAAPTPARAEARWVAARWLRRPMLLGVALVALPLLTVGIAAPNLSASTRSAALGALHPANLAIWVPLAAVLATLLVLSRAIRRWNQPAWVHALSAVLVLDLAVVGWTLDVPADRIGRAAQTALADESWIEPIRASGRRLWVVTPRATNDVPPGEYVDSLDKLAANTNILRGVATLTDYGPLQPRTFARRFALKPWGESLIADELLRDTEWTSAYDVGWILLCEPDLPVPPAFTFHATTRSGYRLFRSDTHRSLATLAAGRQAAQVRHASAGASLFRVEIVPIESVAVDADERRAEAGASRVVFATAAAPGWMLRVNGQPATPIDVDGLLAVDVPPDEACEILGQYIPAGLAEGQMISLAGIGLQLAGNIAGLGIAARRTSLLTPPFPSR